MKGFTRTLIHLLELYLYLECVSGIIIKEENVIVFHVLENSPTNYIIGNLTSYLPASLLTKSSKLTLDNDNKERREIFKISGYSIVVASSKNLDRENICPGISGTDQKCSIKYLLIIQSEKSPTSWKDILIIIDDVNDSKPKFRIDTPSKVVNDCFTIDLSEKSLIDSRFPIPKAFDEDSDLYANLRYEIIDENNSPFNLFIDSEGISLRQTRLVDYELEQTYNLTLRACDSGPNCSDLDICIRILDENDNKPSFLHQNQILIIEEDLKVGMSLGFVKAKDDDYNSILEYKLVSIRARGKPLFDNNLFHLDEKTGELILRQKLLGGRIYELTIEVSDDPIKKRANIARTMVTINVIDVNDNYPDIKYDIIDERVKLETINEANLTHKIFYIFENNMKKIDLSFITVTDRDQGLNADCKCSFIKKSITLPVYITNENKLTDGKTIYKLFINQTFDLEKMPINLSIVDNSLVQKAIEKYQPYNKTLFGELVCSDNGQIQRLETRNMIYLVVLDQNEYPTFFSEVTYNLEVSESQALGKSLINFKFIDDDFSDSERFHRKNSLKVEIEEFARDYFIVDQETLQLILIRSLDAEETQDLSFKIFAVNSGLNNVTLTTDAVVNVRVIDENDNRPVFLTKQGERANFTIVENTEERVLIGKLLARDNDVFVDNNKITYKIVKCSGLKQNPEEMNQQVKNLESCPIEVSPKTGMITSREPIDREIFEVIEISVEASDNVQKKPLSILGNFKIKVLDENDNAPEWKMENSDHQKSNEIYEFGRDLPVNEPIIKLNAIDRDLNENGTVNYHLKNVFDQNDGEDLTELFKTEITNGFLMLKSRGDALVPGKMLQVVVIAKDLGIPEKVAKFHLQLRVINGSESKYYKGNPIYLKNTQSDEQSVPFNQNSRGIGAPSSRGLSQTNKSKKTKNVYPLFIFIIVPLIAATGMILMILFLLIMIKRRRKEAASTNNLQSDNHLGMSDLSPKYKTDDSGLTEIKTRSNFRCDHSSMPLEYQQQNYEGSKIPTHFEELNPLLDIFKEQQYNINKTDTFRTNQLVNNNTNQIEQLKRIKDTQNYVKIYSPQEDNQDFLTGYFISVLPINEDVKPEER